MSMMSNRFVTVSAPAGCSSQDVLDMIAEEISQCHQCSLCQGRTNTVPGHGNPEARVMFVGEAPGKNEDLQGRPFVGAAGQNLSDFLALAGLTREEIFIANILKCRPPSNRNPQPDEIQVCTPFLRDQTRAIGPEVIVTMGNFATQFILKTQRGITSLRGIPVKTGPFTVFPVYHPAAAIYDPLKREVLENDFRNLGRLLGTVN